MNIFGWQKDNMSEELSPAPNVAIAGESNTTSKKDVDLFPALANSAPVVTPRVSAVSPSISMFTPASFEDALDIVEVLRSRASTTICLERMATNDANRLIDFVSGASAVIDGAFHKMSEMVYLFCPSNIKIVVPEQPENKNRPLDFLYSDSLNNSGFSKSVLNNSWSKTPNS